MSEVKERIGKEAELCSTIDRLKNKILSLENALKLLQENNELLYEENEKLRARLK